MRSKGKIEGVSKIVGGKWKRWKGVYPSHSNGHQVWNIPMATKLGTFQWPPSLEPSNGHQAWNLPLATKLWILPLATKLGTFHWPLSFGSFHWPPSFGSTFSSLLLLFKRWTRIMGSSFLALRTIFTQSWTLVDKLLEEGNNV